MLQKVIGPNCCSGYPTAVSLRCRSCQLERGLSRQKGIDQDVTRGISCQSQVIIDPLKFDVPKKFTLEQSFTIN